MRKKKTVPLKVSLFGMNNRAQKLMANSLRMLKDSIDTEVVSDIEGQVEIIDLDLSTSDPNLLEDRLAQHPTKPIIVLSLQETLSNEVMYIKKPLQSAALLVALKKAKTVLQAKTSANTGGTTSETEVTLTNRDKILNSDSQIKEDLSKKIKWRRSSDKPDSSVAISAGSVVMPEPEQSTGEFSNLNNDLPRVVKWTRDISPLNISDDMPTALDDFLIAEIKEESIAENNGIAVSSEVSSVKFDLASANKLVEADEDTMAIKTPEKMDIWADESVSEKKKIVWQRNIAADEFNITELEGTSNKNLQTNKATKPRVSSGNSEKLYQQPKDEASDQKKTKRKSVSRTVHRSSFRSEIAKRKKMSHRSDLQSRKPARDFDLEGGFVNKRRSIRYAFANLKGYFIPNSIIFRNKRKTILILDISSKGAYFRCNSKLKLETKGELAFDFGLAAVYRIPCQIGRVNGGSYSIIFKENNHEICDFLIDSGRMFEIKTYHQIAKTKKRKRNLA